jgi:transposase
LSVQAISELRGYDRKTIGKYLLTPVGRPEYKARPVAASKLQPFKPYLAGRLSAGVWNAQVLLRELRERNYTGGYTILKNWLNPPAGVGADRGRAAIRDASGQTGASRLGASGIADRKRASAACRGASSSRWGTAAG